MHCPYTVIDKGTSNVNDIIYYCWIHFIGQTAPKLTVRTPTESEVSYELIKQDSNTNIVVAGYEVLCFGVPMIYVCECR